MDNNKKKDAHEEGQDNIGYENTESRTDRDDKELNRLQTTDTDNDDGKPAVAKGENEPKDED